MNAASAEADIAFVHTAVANACAAGADEAQARLSYNERVEVDFDTRQVSLLRATQDDDTLLTVFKSTRKGTAAMSGRAPEAIARAVAEALAAAEAAPLTRRTGSLISRPGHRPRTGLQPPTASC